MPKADSESEVIYRIVGMDCARDAREIEREVRRLGDTGVVGVSTTTHLLTVTGRRGGRLDRAAIEEAVGSLGYGIEPIDSGARSISHQRTGYRRALWIVIGLNVGYGIIEMTGGVISGSQALKADALDFLGDGVITLLGVLAIGWSLLWRARAALVQGIFLALLGIGVMVSTAYRVLVQSPPEAQIMGVMGAVALVVNVLAAVALIPYRQGDANVRAVWLFSRNDAIGNLAVVVAAGLVALTEAAWPDLTVAVVIAALFLHSSGVIVRDAVKELGNR